MGGQGHTADLDRPLVGTMHSVQYLEDRRLAGAVAAQQRMDLAGHDLEGHLVQRTHAAEGLGYAGHADRSGARAHPTFSHNPVSPERIRASATSSVNKPSSKFGLGCRFFAMAEKKS